jgi:hypothetical protein
VENCAEMYSIQQNAVLVKKYKVLGKNLKKD